MENLEEELEKDYSDFDQICFFVYPLMAIIFSAFMFIWINLCKYEIRYGGTTSTKDMFNAYEFLEFSCAVCLVVAIFYSLKSYAKIGKEKERLIEKLLIFMVLASILYLFCGLLCLITECGHSKCLYNPFLPLGVWVLFYYFFCYRKEKRENSIFNK